MWVKSKVAGALKIEGLILTLTSPPVPVNNTRSIRIMIERGFIREATKQELKDFGIEIDPPVSPQSVYIQHTIINNPTEVITEVSRASSPIDIQGDQTNFGPTIIVDEPLKKVESSEESIEETEEIKPIDEDITKITKQEPEEIKPIEEIAEEVLSKRETFIGRKRKRIR